jgi:hypothetical protein
MRARGVKRLAGICARGAAWMMLAALLLPGEVSREAYRAAYRSWRLADPTLEHDAATAGAPLGARADRVAAEAATFCSERAAFIGRLTEENSQKLAWTESPVDTALVLSPLFTDYISGQAAKARRAIDSFANDTDPGIQKLRAALERENLALAALNTAVVARQRAAADADRAGTAIEDARKRAVDLNHEYANDLKKAADETALETSAWAEYYRKLSEGARGVSNSVPAPTTSVTARPNDPASLRAPSITSIPLVRYTGDWLFPTDGMYYGAQPQFVDFVVREDNGHADGRLVARFKLPPGSTGDPVLRFEFSGEFKNTRNQTFNLETSDGAKGTINLIPGSAFNLLEINVQIAAKPGKIRQMNVVLIKK